MFSALNPEELNIVIDAMQNVKKHKGENVIKEGDDGDNLYVIEKGTLHCTKIFVSYLLYMIIYELNRKDRLNPLT